MKKATAASRRRREAGFTLIELMVAMVVSAIVVLGVYAFSAIQQSTATMHERNVRVQQALEGAMWTMAQDVRMAGLGFSRICTELRVYDGQGARLINPGAVETPSTAVADQITGSAYWVLRDGLQAHWNSTVGNDFVGDVDRSSSPASVADGFDVILADGVYVGTYGVFRLNTPVTAGMPAWVHGKFMLGSPVAWMPLGAGPGAGGQIHRSMPASAICACNWSRTRPQLVRKSSSSSSLTPWPISMISRVRAR